MIGLGGMYHGPTRGRAGWPKSATYSGIRLWIRHLGGVERRGQSCGWPLDVTRPRLRAQPLVSLPNCRLLRLGPRTRRRIWGWGAGLLSGLLVVAAMGGAPALAETPRSHMVELQVGPYTPAVDGAFVSATPYADSFGSKSLWSFGLYMDFQFWQEVGSLAVGAGARYGWVDGHAVEEDSSDETALNIAPFTLGLTYRFDYLQRRLNIPLVPYVHAGLEWAVWWVTNGKNEISNTRAPTAPFEGRTALSNTFGFYAGGGLQVQLDFFSESIAREFDAESGVNNSYLFVDFTRHELNDFYSSDSIDLSDTALSFGLMFEF